MTELSVDDLIEQSTQPTPEVFAALSEITATASGDGVEVTVNLEGRLIALELTPHALAAGPGPLAAEIFRLAQEASATALNAGIEVLTPAVEDDLAAELRALILPAPAPARPTPAPDDDFSTIETWAVPQ